MCPVRRTFRCLDGAERDVSWITVLKIVQSLAEKNNPVWYYGVESEFLLDKVANLGYYLIGRGSLVVSVRLHCRLTEIAAGNLRLWAVFSRLLNFGHFVKVPSIDLSILFYIVGVQCNG